MRILIAEDDRALRDVLRRGLTESGYVVDIALDGEQALRSLSNFDYEIAVLDWRMPKLSGIEVIDQLRAKDVKTPILMLTARDAPMDRVQGLNAGADDYLVKPFEFSELIARLHALQRRPVLRHTGPLTCGDLEFDTETRELKGNGKLIEVTTTECLLVELFIRRSPDVVSRRTIANQVWSDAVGAISSNTIEVHVARLRAKIADCTTKIETVRGFGYRMVAKK
jgi:DNA-binding response OmpR family regulator